MSLQFPGTAVLEAQCLSRHTHTRRGSRDRDRGAHRAREDTRANEAQPPFSIFPRSEPSDSGPSLRLTPNTEHRSRSQDRSPSRTYEQDLATWHNIDAPPILRRVPLQVAPIEPPPVAMIIHPNRSVQFDFNRAPPRDEQDFFYRLLQSINPSGPAPVTTDPPVNIQYFQPQRQVLPSSDHRTTPASRSRSPTLATNAPRDSREQRTVPFSIPEFLRPRQHQTSESGTETDQRLQSDSSVPARTGSQWTYKWNNRMMDTIALPWKVQTEIPTHHLPFPLLQDCPRNTLHQMDIYVPWLLHDPRIQPLPTNYKQDGQHLDPRTILLA